MFILSDLTKFLIVFQQIEIDNYQGAVHDMLKLPIHLSSAPIMRLFGVTPVRDDFYNTPFSLLF